MSIRNKNSKYNLFSLFLTVMDNHKADYKFPIQVIVKNSKSEVVSAFETTYDDLFMEITMLIEDDNIIVPNNEIYVGFQNENKEHKECFVFEIV